MVYDRFKNPEQLKYQALKGKYEALKAKVHESTLQELHSFRDELDKVLPALVPAAEVRPVPAPAPAQVRSAATRLEEDTVCYICAFSFTDCASHAGSETHLNTCRVFPYACPGPKRHPVCQKCSQQLVATGFLRCPMYQAPLKSG